MYSLIRKLLFLLDAEDAHELTVRQMIALQHIPLALRAIERFCAPPASARREVMGLSFPSPIGIANEQRKPATIPPRVISSGIMKWAISIKVAAIKPARTKQ